MKKETVYKYGQSAAIAIAPEVGLKNMELNPAKDNSLPEILFISSYPPRECGIATYSQDLVKALNTKFEGSFRINICALESGRTNNNKYPDEVKYILDTTFQPGYSTLAKAINTNTLLKTVLVQHEFGLFEKNEADFLDFLKEVKKTVIVVFHTVLPLPDAELKHKVDSIVANCNVIVVMTNNSARILKEDYEVPEEKILVITHGTHLVPHLDKTVLKEKYELSGRKILSTFGLLSQGKSIETTLKGLPAIIKKNPDVLFLVIGKTHPGIVNSEGEKYRDMLESMVKELDLGGHVKFINRFLQLPELLEYLQLTDIYLFTSKDPKQAVSGTFSYAISCGCPVISTPIPHALEVLPKGTGMLIDFDSPSNLTEAVNHLLNDENLRKNIALNSLHLMASTAWENSAIAHAMLFEKMGDGPISLVYTPQPVNLNHIKKMTTDVGMIQFSKINQPDIESGYTLDDNARALIALSAHYEMTGDESDINYINTYLRFIKHCQQADGSFLNYVDSDQNFTSQNNETNLSDANGRAIWALGYLISKRRVIPPQIIEKAEEMMALTLPLITTMYSTRAMAFAIKGLYYYNLGKRKPGITKIIKTLANRLLQMYCHESENKWEWYESYLTYANSILPEAMLYAWLQTGDFIYKETAEVSFDFLLNQTFKEKRIKVISNQSWLQKGQIMTNHGEQPIDVAYTILTLNLFYDVFKDAKYLNKIDTAFSWFLGNNHLQQIIYNPCTGGCYDGLEENHVNLNQGAESALSYLLARLTIEKGEKRAIKVSEPAVKYFAANEPGNYSVQGFAMLG